MKLLWKGIQWMNEPTKQEQALISLIADIDETTAVITYGMFGYKAPNTQAHPWDVEEADGMATIPVDVGEVRKEDDEPRGFGQTRTASVRH